MKKLQICRQVYQSLFVDVADTFIKYINILNSDEIEKLDNDLKAKSWTSEIGGGNRRFCCPFAYFSNVLLLQWKASPDEQALSRP